MITTESRRAVQAAKADVDRRAGPGDQGRVHLGRPRQEKRTCGGTVLGCHVTLRQGHATESSASDGQLPQLGDGGVPHAIGVCLDSALHGVSTSNSPPAGSGSGVWTSLMRVTDCGVTPTTRSRPPTRTIATEAVRDNDLRPSTSSRVLSGAPSRFDRPPACPRRARRERAQTRNSTTQTRGASGRRAGRSPSNQALRERPL